MATGLLVYLRKRGDTKVAELGLGATVGELQNEAKRLWELKADPRLLYGGERLANKDAPLCDAGLSQQAVVDVEEGHLLQWDPEKVNSGFVVEKEDTLVFNTETTGWRWAAATADPDPRSDPHVFPTPIRRFSFALHFSQGWAKAQPHPQHIAVGVVPSEDFKQLTGAYTDGKAGMSCFMMHSCDLRNVRTNLICEEDDDKAKSLAKGLRDLLKGHTEVVDFRVEVHVHELLEVSCYNNGVCIGVLSGTLPPSGSCLLPVVGVYGSMGTQFRIEALEPI
eukprot:Hpha_TRINITY_DN8241_c0_g1::TRINITY_DN8241_c0_g1_i1::g.111970::m.111970